MKLYTPPKFQGEGWQKVVEDHPLATVISGNFVSHLPLLLEARGEELFLIGHLARANPHCKALGGSQTVAIFRGPEAYISPLWYEECDVPTWNYVVAHLSGKARLLEEGETVTALQKLSDKMEGKGGWEFHIPEDLQNTLHKSIAAFEIRVEKVMSKFKLSQNRSPQDRDGVIRGLKARQEARSLEVAVWMEATDASHWQLHSRKPS